MEAVEKFSQMATIWRSRIPKSLAGEDPAELVALLFQISVPGGISQSDLKAAMKISQSRLSRLTKRLLREKWVEVRHPETDRRVLMTSITKTAGRVCNEIDRALAGPPHRRESTGKTRGKRVVRDASFSFFDYPS
jgi:hypothetical protein